MVEFAEHEFRLNKRGKDGHSLRETLKVVEERKGFMPEEGVNPVEFPELLYDLWRWFLNLNSSRPSGMGSTPILESEIRAYYLNRSLTLHGWQLDAIRRLDAVAMNSSQEK